MPFYQIQFLGPARGLIQFPTGQPEPDLVDGGEAGMQM